MARVRVAGRHRARAPGGVTAFSAQQRGGLSNGLHVAAMAVRAGLSDSGASILGPATLFRLRGRERQVLLVKAPPESRSTVIRSVGLAVQRAAGTRAHAGVNYSVDVDPQ